LEELASASERKLFLDAQTKDLTDAMNTLEDAIRKIDGETRELLGGTFKIVNEHFGRMFPELFGGGNAKLVMTGDEILDAGVQVLAQPPGKKNQTIHLLSGAMPSWFRACPKKPNSFSSRTTRSPWKWPSNSLA
jgi:chromosome segregation protein